MKFKSIVWTEQQSWWFGESPIDELWYIISKTSDQFKVKLRDGLKSDVCKTPRVSLEEAKAAAQEDFEKRIKQCWTS